MRNISKNKQNFLEKLSDKITSNPPLYLTLGFAILIIIGGCILSLPIFTRSGKATNLVDSIFVASSASCVTGLTTVIGWTLEYLRSYFNFDFNSNWRTWCNDFGYTFSTAFEKKNRLKI